MLFSSRPVSWLVVFLGNPGLRYEGTRHNAGFMAADAFSRKHDVRISRVRFRALTAQCGIGGDQVLLMKPQTYMNLSGEAVGQAARFYKIPPEHILVLSDDITLPIGALRIRTKGSSLSVFRDQDAEDMAEAASRAADAAECYIAEGPEKAMNRYSQKKVK